MRMPCSVSCIVSMTRAPPVNCMRAIARTRRISLRRKKNAGGTTMTPAIDSSGSCTTMTIDSATSDIRSRPIAVMSRLITMVTAAVPVVSRAMNSEEWRSAKKPMFSRSSLSNRRRLLSATMLLPIEERITVAP